MTPDAAADTLKAGTRSTAVILPLAEAARRMGALDLDLFRLLGTFVTPDPRAARWIGLPLNVVNTLTFPAVYRWAFRALRVRPSVLTGALLGAGHFVLGISGVALLARLHPRKEHTNLRPDKPFGTTARTVPVMLLGHVLYGALVGHALR